MATAAVTVRIENVEPVRGILESVGVLLLAIADDGGTRRVRAAAADVADKINAVAEVTDGKD